LAYFALTEKTRIRLKHPLGQLIIGSPEQTMPRLQELIRQKKPTKICVIGDFLTQKTLEYDLDVDLWLFDGKVMRHPVPNYMPPEIDYETIHNPPGTLSTESVKVIKSITYDRPRAIFVQGEEDLLALLVIKYAPLNSLVLYGQPHVGVVAIIVTENMKSEVHNLLEQMSILNASESLK
jgi:uncharacterized protein (UPF0218 family)